MSNNDLLVSTALLERVLPLLNENTRVSIRRDALTSISRNLDMCVGKVHPYLEDTADIMPILEMIELIKSLMQDTDFVECSDEVKKILIDKTYIALNNIYLFAGKYYMTHDFDYTPGMKMNIIRVVESCINQGFYFGFEKEVQQEVCI